MKRKLTNIAVALVTFGLGVGLVSLLYSTVDSVHRSQIPRQHLITEIPCAEEETAQEFSAFWLEFRSAVQREDKLKLFSMIRKCSFDWSPFKGENLRKPLEINSGYLHSLLEFPFEVRPTSISTWGQDLRFRPYSDFLANYKIVFSESNRRRLLRIQPASSTECEYAVSWREKVLYHLCFDKIDASGYKFSGLRFEP
jgi:hypothetical protein